MRKYKYCIVCAKRLPLFKKLFCSVKCQNNRDRPIAFRPGIKRPIIKEISKREKKLIDLQEWYSNKYPDRNPRKDVEKLKIAFDSLQKLIKEIKTIGCMACGYNKSYAGLHFHHINGKDETIAKLQRGNVLGILKEFLEHDIVLICANCHSEVHEGSLDISQLEPININGIIATKTSDFRHL